MERPTDISLVSADGLAGGYSVFQICFSDSRIREPTSLGFQSGGTARAFAYRLSSTISHCDLLSGRLLPRMRYRGSAGPRPYLRNQILHAFAHRLIRQNALSQLSQLHGERPAPGAKTLSREFNPACSLHNSANIQFTSRPRQVDGAGFNEFHSISDMIGNVCLLSVPARFVEQQFQHSRSGRRHSWILLTSTTGSIETVALHHYPHIVAMTGQSNIGFAGLGSACNIVNGRGCCAALDGIC